MFVGVDVIQVTIKHPTLGSLTLFPKAGENAQMEPGGLITESDPKGITGAGYAIYKKTMQRWVVELPPIAWARDVTADTLDKLREISSSFEESDFTFELADGSVRCGKGVVVDALKGATFDSTIPLKMEGGGILKPIS